MSASRVGPKIPNTWIWVSFDDIDGGKQAARYLIGLGHRQIAYLAMHPQIGEPGVYLWSAHREAGWRDAMTEAGLSVGGLTFRPEIASFRADVEPLTCRLIGRSDISAVVAANDVVALALFRALRSAHVPAERWPVVVGFDNLPRARRYPLTSFHLPWDEIGRTAADLLWQRRQGQSSGKPVHRRVPMSLIRRLTSQSAWSAASYAVISVAADADARMALSEQSL